MERLIWTPSEVVDVDGPRAMLRAYLEQRDVRTLLATRHRARVAAACDIGCGFGRMTSLLGEFAGAVVGFEREPALVATARALMPAVDVRQIDRLSQLPVPDASFDIGLVFTVLQHVPEPGVLDVVTEILRVMKPSGTILLCEETDVTLEAGDRAHGELGYTCGRAPELYANWLSPWRLVAAKPRVIEPDYPRPDVGSYMLFAGPDAADTRSLIDRMDLQLRDTVAIVTGSSRGLGLASATALAAEGARVVVCGRDAARLEAARGQVAAAAGAGGADRVLAVAIDLSTPDGPGSVVEQAAAHFGGVDVLVNNVGMAKGAGLVDTPDAAWQEALDYTLYPAVRASRAAVPHMIRRGGGSIVLIASIYGREAGGRLTYNVVKAAEISLGKALARELAPKNIRVNTIAPGSILFPGGSWHQRQQSDPAGIADFVARELPFGRFGRVEEIGDAVAWLASPRASWVSGACIPVDGCQGRSNI